jgi:hypothetical protein
MSFLGDIEASILVDIGLGMYIGILTESRAVRSSIFIVLDH